MKSRTDKPFGTVYLIRCNHSGLHKIGITNNWARRSKELKVGETTTAVTRAFVQSPYRIEQGLHRRYASRRLPQSEWFNLSSTQVADVLEVLGDARRQYLDMTMAFKQQLAAPARPPAPTGPWRSKKLLCLAWSSLGLTAVCAATGAGITPFMACVATPGLFLLAHSF